MQVGMPANNGSEQRATAEHLCKDGVLDILLTDVFEIPSILTHVVTVLAIKSSLHGKQDAVGSLLSDITWLLTSTRPPCHGSILSLSFASPHVVGHMHL